MSNINNWAYIWVCHLIQHAKPVEDLPAGWCVYCEGDDWD